MVKSRHTGLLLQKQPMPDAGRARRHDGVAMGRGHGRPPGALFCLAVWLCSVSIHAPTDTCLQIFHPPDAEGNQGQHSMVNDMEDVVFNLWDSTVGKVLYRVAKHGSRTGESFIGATIRIKSGRSHKDFIVVSASGNTFQTKHASSIGKTFNFPGDIDLPCIISITLPNDGQIMHLESCICVGTASTLSFKAGTLTRVSGTDGTVAVKQLSRNSERDFNVGDSELRGSQLFGKMSRCAPLSHNGQIFQVDTRTANGKKGGNSAPCVPVYTDGNVFYSLFMAGTNAEAIKQMQLDDLDCAGIVDRVAHSKSSTIWPMPRMFVDPLFSGKIEYAVRVNVARDMLGVDSQYNRCFDSLVRSHMGGQDGNTYPVTSTWANRATGSAITNEGAMSQVSASECQTAAKALDTMLEEGTVKYGLAIFSLDRGLTFKAYNERKSVPKYAFWDAFPKMASAKYGLLLKFISARMNSPSRKQLVFTEGVHEMMRRVAA
jgi:hypothetical protein